MPGRAGCRRCSGRASGAVGEPGIHQPAHGPVATRTWRRPRTKLTRSTSTDVAPDVVHGSRSRGCRRRRTGTAPRSRRASCTDVAGATTVVPANPATWATALSRTHRPSSAPPTIRSHVPPGGSVRRARAMTSTGLVSVTVTDEVVRQAASNVTPRWGPASSRTGSSAAAAGAGATVRPAAAVTAATRARTRGRRARAAAMGATLRFGFRPPERAPGMSPMQPPSVTIR